MKLNIEIDLTADEARRVMGLPDITKMQEKLVAEMEKRMLEAIKTTSDPEALLRTWFSWGTQGLEQFQRFVSDAQRTCQGSQRALRAHGWPLASAIPSTPFHPHRAAPPLPSCACLARGRARRCVPSRASRSPRRAQRASAG